MMDHYGLDLRIAAASRAELDAMSRDCLEPSVLALVHRELASRDSFAAAAGRVRRAPVRPLTTAEFHHESRALPASEARGRNR